MTELHKSYNIYFANYHIVLTKKWTLTGGMFTTRSMYGKWTDAVKHGSMTTYHARKPTSLNPHL